MFNCIFSFPIKSTGTSKSPSTNEVSEKYVNPLITAFRDVFSIKRMSIISKKSIKDYEKKIEDYQCEIIKQRDYIDEYEKSLNVKIENLLEQVLNHNKTNPNFGIDMTKSIELMYYQYLYQCERMCIFELVKTEKSDFVEPVDAGNQPVIQSQPVEL